MDTLTPQQRSERMARIRSRDTKPELILRKLVHGMGYRYRLNRRDVVGNPDLAFIGRRKALFLHGCFWHRHDCPAGRRVPKSRLDFWEEKFSKNVERDALVSEQLRKAGWRLLVVWECQLRDLTKVARKIRKFLDA